MSKRWVRRPEGSNWGDFGQDDQLGRLNLIGPEQVRKGVAEVREGRSFCLSLPLDYPGGMVLNLRREPPRLRPMERDGKPLFNFPMALLEPTSIDVACDDQVLLTLQYSTQWDAFSHVGALFDADGDGHAERVYYNGYRANEHVKGPAEYTEHEGRWSCACGTDGASRAEALGIENFAVKAIQGRAVMVDLHAHFGNAHHAVNFDDLQRILATDRVVVEPGDMLVLHTGFADVILGMHKNPDPHVVHHSCTALDGSDPRLLQWITDSGISAICADNYAVERYPSLQTGTHKRAILPLHHHCLFKLGIPLGELWWLGELAPWLRAQGRSRFLLTAPPLRLPGAVGSPVTPVATV